MCLRCLCTLQHRADNDGGGAERSRRCSGLVDRLWTRGLHKADAAVDLWMKDVAPRTQLRRWFGHEPARRNEFQRRYRTELASRAALLKELRGMARSKANVDCVNEQSSCEQHQRHRPEWLLQHGAKDPGRAGGPALDSHSGGKSEATDE